MILKGKKKTQVYKDISSSTVTETIFTFLEEAEEQLMIHWEQP